MSYDHVDKFWSCFPVPPNQPAVGGAPQVYLAKLHDIGELTHDWPSNHPTGQVSRSQLRAICRDPNVDVLIGYAAVMAWGNRGVDSRNYRLSLSAECRQPLVQILQYLRASTGSRMADFAEMQQAAESIKGLGISFYTKLLFFFREKSDAYILDQFTAKSARLLFDDCQVVLNSSDYPDADNKPSSYEWFCSAVEDLGASRITGQRWSGEVTEQAMFDVRGGAWRNYLRSFYGKAGTPNIRKRKVTVTLSQPPSGYLQPLKMMPLAHEGLESLPELVARFHASSYQAGEELPGATPRAGTSPPFRIHCSRVDEVNWQYAFQKKSIHAQVFIPPSHVARYEALRDFLKVPAHDFGDGIRGTGEKQGKTRSLKVTISGGLDTPRNEWEKVARDAVAAMVLLYERVREIL
ncbi:MAG: hypothetical protein WCO60_06995 [Verrucomicrobiota bacterium]